MKTWNPGADRSQNLALKNWMCLENFKNQGELIFVCHYCEELLPTPSVDYGTNWFVTLEKWEKRDFIHHEIERLVDLRVTLLQGPLVHLGN